MEQHFVTFLSPGTFVSEATEKPIASWDVEEAKALASSIYERHGSRPYGFVFTTRARADDELDSRETARSGVYYLGGVIRTLEEVERDNKPDEDILRFNMRVNGYKRVVQNRNSWSFTGAFGDGDTLLDFTFPAPVAP